MKNLKTVIGWEQRPKRLKVGLGIGLLAGVVVISILILGETRMAKTERSPIEPPTSISTPIPTGSSATAHWEVYTDRLHGYSVKYPPGWYLYPAPTKGLGGSTKIYSCDRDTLPAREGPMPADQIKIEIVVLDNPSQDSVDAWLRANPRMRQGYGTQSQQRLTVDGVPAVMFTETRDAISNISVLLTKGTRLYLILVTPPDSKYMDVFETILSTFAAS